MDQPTKKLPASYEAFREDREIPRLVEPPQLSSEEIAEITRTIFVLPTPIPSDVLIVFGSSCRQFERLGDAYRQGLYRRVLATGLPGKQYFDTGESLARVAYKELVCLGVPADAILLEETATNTLEEVERGIPILRTNNVPLERLIFACARPHSGRCYRTLKRFLPEAQLTCIPFDSEKNGILIHESTWQNDDTTKAAVYAEYLRIKTYAARGDITNI